VTPHDEPIWRPSSQRIAAARMTRFAAEAQRRYGVNSTRYSDLWNWSIAQPEQFWSLLWSFCNVIGQQGSRVLAGGDAITTAQWFPEARLNFAQNLLRGNRADDADAVVFWGENKVRRRLTYAALHDQVAATAAALRSQGIGPGDCVAAYMPNMPETLIAMLAAASIGAVFTSTSPDFGVQGVLDRFEQTRPKILFAADGYWYNGKRIDCRDKLRDISARLNMLQRLVLVPYLEEHPSIEGIAKALSLDEYLAPHRHVRDIEYAQLPFDHPLYVLYSSGTTGVPKCIVHGAGGTLLQHLKEHQLHCDLNPGDRFFYFTTCGWMMWNYLASTLGSGATVLLYDGSPFAQDGRILFEYVQAERATHFGVSAKFIDAVQKAALTPGESFDLANMRVILSTGSPLSAESFEFVYRSIKQDVQLSSISGGTDICSCFVLGSPTLPVWRGEIQCRGLGMAVDVFDANGRPVKEEKGELVCTQPFPCRPVGFLNDPDGRKYRAAYFERFAGVWCHGDFCELTAHDGVIIYGRSDATLNPGGVRIGTAEIYRQVETLPEILEAVVIGQEWQHDVRVVLFVRLQEGLTLDDALRTRIKKRVRDNTTPRHVPAKILQVSDIPRTRSGKIVELAVRNVVHGEPVKNIEALANPEALELFKNRVELG